MSWRDLDEGGLLVVWSALGGPIENAHRDKNAFKRLLEHYAPVAIARFILAEGIGETVWALERRMRYADMPEGRIATELELVNMLKLRGMLPETISPPWLAWLTYQDLYGGLGIPNAALAKAYTIAEQQLEQWLDTEFLNIPVPTASRAGAAQRHAERPQARRQLKDLGYLE